jgi:hypothetical protein
MKQKQSLLKNKIILFGLIGLIIGTIGVVFFESFFLPSLGVGSLPAQLVMFPGGVYYRISTGCFSGSSEGIMQLCFSFDIANKLISGQNPYNFIAIPNLVLWTLLGLLTGLIISSKKYLFPFLGAIVILFGFAFLNNNVIHLFSIDPWIRAISSLLIGGWLGYKYYLKHR